MSKTNTLNIRVEPKCNKETIEIIKEALEIIKNPENYQSFNSVDELMEELNRNND